MSVTFTRDEVKKLSLVCDKVSDCCDGDFKVKEKEDKYLPRPNASDKSAENLARYQAYLNRAIFYNVTKNTLSGLLGQIFSKEAQVELPPELEVLNDNCDGRGNSIVQVAKQGITSLLKAGRFGLFSDFPKVESELSKDELIEQDIRPIIRLYSSQDIINWQFTYVGAEVVYTLIVLKEKYTQKLGIFESKEVYRFRVLKLNEDGNYEVEVWNSEIPVADSSVNLVTSISPTFEITESTIPTTFDGSFIKRIPFEFCGVESNVSEPNVPVLYDIANLNIGHYRNSADYEESCYITGQPTVWFAGLSQEWVENVLKGRIELGSRGGVMLPLGASGGLLQSTPNTMPYEAMKHKEEQFLALGAKLVSPNSAAITATEAEMNNTSETSILATLANNASEAIENAIEHCQLFVNSTAEPIFKLNNDFEISKLTTAERSELIREWQTGAISFTEMRNNLRSGKVQLLEDGIAQSEIDQETLDSFAQDMKNPAVNPALTALTGLTADSKASKKPVSVGKPK